MFFGTLTSAIGFAAVTLLLLIPMGIVLLGCRKGYVASSLVVLLISAAAGFAFGNIMAVAYTFLLIAPFITILIYCINSKIGFGRSVSIGMLTLVMMIFVVIIIANVRAETPLAEQLENSIYQWVIDNPDFFEDLMTQYAQLTGNTLSADGLAVILSESILTAIPAVLVVFSLYAAVLDYAVSAYILNKKWDSKVPIKPLGYWDFTTKYGCIIFVAFMVLFFLSASGITVADTLMTIAILVFFVMLMGQGYSVAYFFALRWKFPKWLALVLITLLCIAFPYGFVLLGLVDKLFRLRLRYLVRKGEIKVIVKNGRMYIKDLKNHREKDLFNEEEVEEDEQNDHHEEEVFVYPPEMRENEQHKEPSQEEHDNAAPEENQPMQEENGTHEEAASVNPEETHQKEEQGEEAPQEIHDADASEENQPAQEQEQSSSENNDDDNKEQN